MTPNRINEANEPTVLKTLCGDRIYLPNKLTHTKLVTTFEFYRVVYNFERGTRLA